MKIAVALSGGFDSFFSALLLKEDGNDVVGVTFTVKDIFNGVIAKRAAELLGIKFLEIDITESFIKMVIEPFIDYYIKGLTPNPCALCNRRIKSEVFLKKALSLSGADFLATGHYTEKIEIDSSFTLREHFDEKKSQTYFLSLIREEALERLLFPLKDYKKEEVKSYLMENYPDFFSGKKESFEVCFVKNKKYYNFIRKKIKRKSHKGLFLDEKGNILGTHSGYYKYTIGQRRGLRISANKKLYVYRIDANRNIVYLGGKDKVFKNRIIVKDPNFFVYEDFSETFLRIRYKGELSRVNSVERFKDKIVFEVEEPLFAVTPGQVAVLYRSDKKTVIMGGIIVE